METHYFLLLCSLLFGNNIFSQSAGIKGVILDENQNPISSVNIQVYGGIGTETDASGFYRLQLPANRKFNHKHFPFKF